MNRIMSNFMGQSSGKSSKNTGAATSSVLIDSVPQWEEISHEVLLTDKGRTMQEQRDLWKDGCGDPHTDAQLRLFDSKDKPRVVYYRDNAAWCPYCQKVWILLEEKKIPYKVEKINMRSYGDKPQEFLRKVPNGLLPAIELDGKLQTDSLSIMLNLERTFTGPEHVQMWPADDDADQPRAVQLMRLERDLFSRWCGAVFRPSMGGGAVKSLADCLDQVDKELAAVPESPWFLSYLSIVDLTYISHVERMCASLAYWTNLKIRGDGRWPALESWMDAFEELPSYLATKSDYYTHVMDIPPQYGPGFPVPGSEKMANIINGRDGGWRLPLPAFSPSTDVEPVSAKIDPGEAAARLEAAFKLTQNHEAVVKFALRGAGSKGAKQFQAPLADPYAVPNLDYYSDTDTSLRWVAWALVKGYESMPPLTQQTTTAAAAEEEGGQQQQLEVMQSKRQIAASLGYLRDRIGVPRDMSYPAARQLRAHLNWVIDSYL